MQSWMNDQAFDILDSLPNDHKTENAISEIVFLILKRYIIYMFLQKLVHLIKCKETLTLGANNLRFFISLSLSQ